MSMGTTGCVYSMSRRQRLNTRSLTKAELVGVNDAMNMVLWSCLFLEAQGGFTVTDNILRQDNQSAMLLEKNGKMSSSRRTRHLEI